ncbi:MAG: DNA modification methylase [Crocinitomicaceae bacterium]|nr:DNA modification methylase [Crocinitomicaceae bacterium]
MIKVEKIDKRELRLNPLSLKIYGAFSFQNEMDIALYESIILEGIKEPLIITKSKLVISGNRRLQVGLNSPSIQKVPVIFSDLTDDQVDEYQFITHNIQRVKNEIQIGREYEMIGRHYKSRQGVKKDKEAKEKTKTERENLLENSSSLTTINKVLQSKRMIMELEGFTEEEAWDELMYLRVNKKKEVNTINIQIKSEYHSTKNEEKAFKEELYKDEYFQIIHGSSTDLSKYLKDQTIDCVPTSPPYFNGVRNYQEDSIQEDGDQEEDGDQLDPNAIQMGHEEKPEDYIERLMLTLRESIRVLKDTGSIFVNVQDHTRDGVLLNMPYRIIQAMEREGMFNVQNIIWYKINPLYQSRKTFQPSNEYILHFVKDVKKYKWRSDWFGSEDKFLGDITYGGEDKKRLIRSVLIYPSNEIKNGIGIAQGLIQTKVINNHYLVKVLKRRGYALQHNALFPLEIPMICILSTTDRGDSILDVYSGMASTGIVAFAHGCKYYGVDSSRVYSVQAGHRIQDFLEHNKHLIKS